MQKPKPYIHHRRTGHHDMAGVLVFGKIVLPVSILMTVYGFVALGLLIWGFVGSNMVDWQHGWAFIPLLVSVGVFTGVWALVLIFSVLHWIFRTVRQANTEGSW